MTTAVRIRAKREGFRRAGIAHSREWVTHPAGTFTAEQLEALEEEAMLEVQSIQDTAPPAPEAGQPAGKAAKPAKKDA